MTGLQEIRDNLLFGEETSDHERSILLVEIMNAIGFSKNEREIHIHDMHLLIELSNIFRRNDILTCTITGSASEGMCDGVYNNKSNHDYDMLMTVNAIKLYTPRTNNVNNTPLLPLHDNEDYLPPCFVEEDDNFPGYVKLSLTEVQTNDDKHYFSNSMMMDAMSKKLVESWKGWNQFEFGGLFEPVQKFHINGPAFTAHCKDNGRLTHTVDSVFCIHYDTWPNSANSFITRRKPNNWPSKSMLENIKSQGCDVAPVGHHDSQNSDIQWRISFPGERSLLLDLTEVQILCYALIKIILRENLNTSQRELVSSFHIKHVIFWCVELCSCQWVYSNYINCMHICLAKLIQMIQARHIPHYIIESRNLFNSKMTENMSKKVVDILSKYDTTHVFLLDAFDSVFEVTDYNNTLLKHETLKSTIIACFNANFTAFSSYVINPSLFWNLCIPHNATNSLLKYVNILQNLKKNMGMSMHYVNYLIRSIVGFLYYATYKESNKTDLLLASKRLIQKSLNLDNSCVKLRAATFFLSNLEYSKSIEICDTFLGFPPRHQMYSYYYVEYFKDIRLKVHQQLCNVKTTEEVENIMKAILPMFYSTVELKSLPENYDITQRNIVWIFRNLTNIVFHGLCMKVTFMTAEKWVVPHPILYELLSLPHNGFSGIHLDPIFVPLQTKFLCYHSIGNVQCMVEMLTLMNSHIIEYILIFKTSYVYYNMLAYCQIKAGHHKQSVRSILISVCIFPSRYNAASGYLKIVLQILNSLSI
jgi:hypothetical protein